MSLDTRVLNANLSPTERRVRQLQRDYLDIPHRRARLRAEILSIELGSSSHPIALDAWRRVDELHTAYRAELKRRGLSTD